MTIDLTKYPTPEVDAAAEDNSVGDLEAWEIARRLEREKAALREALEKFASAFTDKNDEWSGTEYSRPAAIFECWEDARATLEATKLRHWQKSCAVT